MKKQAACLLAVLLLAAGCQTGGDTGSPVSEAEAREGAAQSGYDRNSTCGDWDESGATRITLEGSSAAVEGPGATVNGGVVTISSGGDYLISGVLADGQIYVKADKDDTVRLVLNGAEITSSTSAGIYSAQADTTVVILPEGTDNTVTDAAAYVYPDSAADEPDAAVFAKDNLVITGSGSLTVNGSFNNGIGCKDDLVIENGTLVVTAANHGIRGRDSLTVLDGSLTVTSGSDGLQSNNPDADKGWILLEGGLYNITSGNDGIQSESTLTITGGEYDILSGGGSAATPADAEGSYKGIKAGTDLTVSGGALRIDSADDTVHAGGGVTISGGSLSLSSGDDGIHADGDVLVSGGTVDIPASCEGLEGATVEISGGEVNIAASDDGINAAGGSDSAGGGRFGQDQFRADSSYRITFSGGLVTIRAGGDGIDSNGNVYMTGGTVLVNGPTGSGDGALDYDGVFEISGGVLAAAGSSGMAQAPSDTSGQRSLQVYFTSTQAAGTPFHLAEADGTPILTFTPEMEYQNIVVSIPELADGGTYRICSGGSADGGTAGSALVLGGTYTGGTLLTQVTLSGTVTRISDTGEAVSGGMGMGGMGGGRGGMGGQPGGTPPDGTPPDGTGRMGRGGGFGGTMDQPGTPPDQSTAS